MPHVSIYSYPEHTSTEKQKLCNRIKTVVVEELHVNESSVSVSFQEVQKEDWKKAVYDQEIYTEKNDLIIKPSYSIK